MQKEGLGVYLYCFYQGGGSLPDLVGIDRDHKVFTLSYGYVNAAVSLVPLQEFDARPLEGRIGDLEWVAPRVLVHERIIEEIMAAYPVMPMRFCTIFAATDRIEELLEIHHTKISRFFSEITDKQEWGVKAYLDAGQLQKVLKRQIPQLQAVGIDLGEASLPVRCTQTGPGQAYLLGKKRDLAIKDELNSIVLKITEELFQGLLANAVKGVENKPLKLEDDEKGEMILNAAFLVRKSDLRSFDEKVKETEEEYRNRGLAFSVTGPWPPYNFCPVFGDEINRA
jgi:hypothetical protein